MDGMAITSMREPTRNRHIIANRRLSGMMTSDDKAQKALADFLEARHLRPTILIHRGHSYHVKSTIDRVAPAARIVVLGSCGGYNV